MCNLNVNKRLHQASLIHTRCTTDDRKSKGGGEKLYLRNNILGGKDFSDLHS